MATPYIVSICQWLSQVQISTSDHVWRLKFQWVLHPSVQTMHVGICLPTRTQ